MKAYFYKKVSRLWFRERKTKKGPVDALINGTEWTILGDS